MKPGDILLLGEHPLPQGRGEERPRLRRAARRARRHLCQRRLLGRAPRACLDRRARPQAAGLCRPHHAGRARRARRRRWRRRRSRWPPSSAAPRSRPSSTCSATCSPRSMCWSSAAAWPTPSSPRKGMRSASRWPSTTLADTARAILAKAKAQRPRDRPAGRCRGGQAFRGQRALARGRGRRRRPRRA